MSNIITAIISSLVGAAIAVFGSIYGARMGADRAMEGVLEILKEQMQVEAQDKEKERVENAIYTQNIIFTFLNKEIERNYAILDITGDKNLPIGTNFKLEFDEFERTKYELLKNPIRSVREINKLYSLFYDMISLNDNNQVQEKLKKIDEIIEQKDMVDILLSDVKYIKSI